MKRQNHGMNSVLRKQIPLLACCLGIALGLAALAAHAESPSPAAVDADGFRSLFDGKTLAGWDGDPRLWSVQDGCITGQTTRYERSIEFEANVRTQKRSGLSFTLSHPNWRADYTFRE